MIYGVFIEHNGAWKLHGTFQHKSDALREVAYLREMLGVNARLFQR